MERERDQPLFERLAGLPGAGPLLQALGDRDGIYAVGGAIRDLLLGSEPVDIDVVVEGDPEELVRSIGAPARVHDRFGTATVELEGHSYDIARARRETYSRPGALPTVAPATIDEDLERRDFTVNAMALAVGGSRKGELIAFPGAVADLEGRRLRVLHEASFSDDPTRLLRLARYANRLGFRVDEHTLALARSAVGENVFATVSGSRLGAELRLLASEPDPVGALSVLRDLGLDEALASGFSLTDPQLARRALELLGDTGDPGTVVLAAAWMSVMPDELADQLDRLAFAADQRDAILSTAGGARELAQALDAAARPSEIAAAARGRPPEAIALAGALGPAAAAARWLTELRHVELEIDGEDLVKAGVPPGPPIGAGLRAALAAKLDDQVTGRSAELARALEVARGSG